MKNFLLAIIIVLFARCTKTKIGTYVFIVEGTNYTIKRDAFCCDTTGTYTIQSYRTENEVKVHHVSNSTVEIDDNVWIKNGKNLTCSIHYDTNDQIGHALGGREYYDQTYKGKTTSTTLIEGTFHEEYFSATYGSSVITMTINANFTIRKK